MRAVFVMPDGLSHIKSRFTENPWRKKEEKESMKAWDMWMVRRRKENRKPFDVFAMDEHGKAEVAE